MNYCKSEALVCTMPITVRESLSFRKSLTPLFASIVARGLDAELTVAEGCTGLNIEYGIDTAPTEDTTRQLTEPQSTELRFIRDDSDDYKGFVSDKTNQLYDDNLLEIIDRKTLSCECGIVNVDEEALQKTSIDKLKHIELNANSDYSCAHCKSPLIPSEDQYLVTNSEYYMVGDLSTMALPSYVRKKIDAMTLQRAAQKRIISKQIKGPYVEVSLGGEEFSLDPGFSMSFTPLFAGELYRNVVVMAGATRNEELLGAMATWSHFRNKDELKALHHPIVNFKTVKNLGELSVNELVNSIGVNAIKGALGLTLQWRTHQSTLTDQDISLTQKSITRTSPENESYFETIEQLLEILKNDNVRKSFKRFRQGVPMTNEDALIKNALFGDIS